MSKFELRLGTGIRFPVYRMIVLHHKNTDKKSIERGVVCYSIMYIATHTSACIAESVCDTGAYYRRFYSRRIS